MLNETFLLNNLRIKLGSKLFEALPPEYYINILKTRTLYLWSSYYPSLVKNIKITQNCAVPTLDPINGIQEYHKYIIPKINAEDEYLGIESYLFPGQNYDQIYSGFGSVMADAALSKIRSLQTTPAVIYRAEFEAPNFCEVYPYRRNHIDFSLTMQRMKRLSEIAFGYHDIFINLFVADVKDAIYHEFPAARENGVLNGVEINTDISNFSSAEGDRKDIIDELKNDYYLDPSRFETMLSQS